MRPKTFKIIYMLDGKTINTQCSIYYLHKYIDKLIEDGSRQHFLDLQIQTYPFLQIMLNQISLWILMLKRKTNTIIQDIIIIIDNIKVTR